MIIILAHNHGSQSRLSYGPVDENGNYKCLAENVTGLAYISLLLMITTNITTNIPTKTITSENLCITTVTLPPKTQGNHILDQV